MLKHNIKFPRTCTTLLPRSPRTAPQAPSSKAPSLFHCMPAPCARGQTPTLHPHTMDSPPSEVSPDNGSSGGRSQGHHKKRVRVWTEDDRAKHRVFEKGRREAFSDSLLVKNGTSRYVLLLMQRTDSCTLLAQPDLSQGE
jgi:hypothetical protein